MNRYRGDDLVNLITTRKTTTTAAATKMIHEFVKWMDEEKSIEIRSEIRQR